MTANAALPFRSKATVVALGTVGAYITVVLGVIVPAWIAAGIEDSTANYLVSAEKAGMMLSALGLTAVIQRWNRRALGLVFLAGLVATNLASAPLTSATALAPFRFLCGVCEGGVIALMTAAAMDTGTADRTFGIYLTATLGLSWLLMNGGFDLIGDALGAEGLPAFFYAMALVSALVIPLMRTFPASPQEVARAAGQPAASGSGGQTAWGYLWPALIATALFEACIMAIWNNMVLTASSAGFDKESVLFWVLRTLLIGIPGGLGASLLADRAGRALPLVVGVGAMVLSLLLVIALPGRVPFGVVSGLFVFSWFFTLPYFVGAVAALDTTGRAATLSIAFQTGGLMAGPLLAGAILATSGNDYTLLPYAGVALLCVCLALVLPTVSARARRSSASLATP